jgi:hypothetical protein
MAELCPGMTADHPSNPQKLDEHFPRGNFAAILA